MKTQISLCIHAVWSESLQSVWRNFASLAIQNAPSEDSEQTAQMLDTYLKVQFLTVQLIFVRQLTPLPPLPISYPSPHPIDSKFHFHG